MPFGVAAAGISAAAGIAGGMMQSNAIKSGQSQANAAVQQGIQTATNQLSPWATTGVTTNTDQADLLGLNGQDAANAAMAKFQQSPGYTWQMQQGLRGVDAGAAAQGMLRSGATLKAEDTFAQGLANSNFQQYFQNLQGLSGQGLTAAQGIANAATGGAANIAQTDTSAAAAQSSIYGNEAKSVATNANQLLSSPQFQSWYGGLGSAPQQMTGFAPAMVPGQVGVGGFQAR
jgi:hypothetical protein